MNRSPLRHPVVIGGVVMGLLAVTVLNLKTFLPGGSLLQRGGNHAAGYLTPPSDLADVVREAVSGDAAAPGLAASAAAEVGGLARDPFSGIARRPVAPRPRAAAPEAPRAPRPTPLACTAVMLGGTSPLALIDGKACRPGDLVRGHQVLSISPDGVRLKRPDGGELTLAVGAARADSATFHVVTETRIKTGTGETRLADDPVERNPR